MNHKTGILRPDASLDAANAKWQGNWSAKSGVPFRDWDKRRPVTEQASDPQTAAGFSGASAP